MAIFQLLDKRERIGIQYFLRIICARKMNFTCTGIDEKAENAGRHFTIKTAIVPSKEGEILIWTQDKKLLFPKDSFLGTRAFLCLGFGQYEF